MGTDESGKFRAATDMKARATTFNPSQQEQRECALQASGTHCTWYFHLRTHNAIKTRRIACLQGPCCGVPVQANIPQAVSS
jgi:hypothetical protein